MAIAGAATSSWAREVAAAAMNWPMLLPACPRHRAVMNHRPIVHLNNLQVVEITSPSPSGLAKSRQNGDNRLPQLAFHSILLLVVLQEISWTPTAFFPRASPKNRYQLTDISCSQGLTSSSAISCYASG